MRVARRVAIGLAFALATPAWAGCTSVLGDFSVGPPNPNADSGADSSGEDASSNDASSNDSSSTDGGRGDSAIDAKGDGMSDAGPPVGPPGVPGFGLSAGAAVMKSANYKVYAVLGESPGGNTVSKSASYTLHGGVIGTTN
jgi:hypothetical protein